MKFIKDVAKIKNGSSNSDNNIENGIFPLFDRSKVIKHSNKYLFDSEGIIIPGEGKEFIPIYYKGKFDLHQRCYFIDIFSKDYLPKFLFYYIFYNNNYFSKVAVGSTVPSLRLRHIEQMQIPSTILEFQQHIVDII
ncbi:restriction endonuclease subunit S [Ureaplasma sp. ES3154-GEN]|uniref:restriction endonuclease subunit S n=1 Tax=Ureaplasma sp. ES3154-GEN TaxID=2984844 RepID=UPI0021E971A1|nr:restriction endonuclease subunit S [Ureaplasma sp. ES3154-GEN]MCV3743502.1 restriction endonuclease subunit S [Ureaplasma sp. ES3154-GEN]